MGKVPNLNNPCTWPRKVRHLVENISGLFMFSFLLAREKGESHSSPLVRLAAERDAALHREALHRQHLELLRRRLERIPAKERPQYAPEDRHQIIILIRLNKWDIKTAAKNLVLDEGTLRRWFKEFRENPDCGLFFADHPPISSPKARGGWPKRSRNSAPWKEPEPSPTGSSRPGSPCPGPRSRGFSGGEKPGTEGNGRGN